MLCQVVVYHYCSCCFLADVIAKAAYVIATKFDGCVFGRCYCQVAVAVATVVDSSCLADVNAKVADGMPTMGMDICQSKTNNK